MTALTTVAAADSRPSLISRQVDFWLLGGASIAFWAVCHLLEFLAPKFSTAEGYLLNIPALFAFSALIINAPHFMASYHLAYTRGVGFITAHWFQLIAVPIALFITLLAGDMLFAVSIDAWGEFALGLNYYLAPLGVFLVVGTYSTLGPELLHHMVNFMYLTVGWHYTKQVFGCFMVYSSYDNYSLTGTERNLIKASLLSIWGFNFFSMNSVMTQTHFFTAGSTTHVFPMPLLLFFQYGTLVLFLLVG